MLVKLAACLEGLYVQGKMVVDSRRKIQGRTCGCSIGTIIALGEGRNSPFENYFFPTMEQCK